MAATVVFALLGSLVFALVLMPVLAAVFLKGATEHETWLLRLAHGSIVRVLGFGMRLAVARHLGRRGGSSAPAWSAPSSAPSSCPSSTRARSRSRSSAAVGLPRGGDRAGGGAVERSLRARFPAELRTVVSKTGRAEIATDPMGVDFSDLIVMLHPVDWVEAHDKESLVARWRRACGRTCRA
jgi:cobalt-zinc-cadmium resistance protein CzcA